MNNQVPVTTKSKSQVDNLSTVTYHFADGSTQVSQISPESFYDEKGRKRNIESFKKLFDETAHDLGATSFTL